MSTLSLNLKRIRYFVQIVPVLDIFLVLSWYLTFYPTNFLTTIANFYEIHLIKMLANKPNRADPKPKLKYFPILMGKSFELRKILNGSASEKVKDRNKYML